jgi:hypothetical protein
MLREVLTDALGLSVGLFLVASGARGGEFFYGPLQGSVRGPEAPTWLGRAMFIFIGSLFILFILAHIFFGFASIPQ